MIEKIRTVWRDQHLSRKCLDLGFGYLDRSTMRLHFYQDIKPNVVIIGAQKCATSSLAAYMARHTDIHVSSNFKEPGYFIFDEWAKEYWNEIRKYDISTVKQLKRRHMLRGYSGQPFFCEATTRYTLGKEAERYQIADKFTAINTRLIYIIRNPFARMVSLYNHVKERNPRSFDELVIEDSSVLDTSLYDYQLSQYEAFYRAGKILVLQFDDLVLDPRKTVNRVFDFLGVDPGRFPSDYEFPIKNKSTQKVECKYSEKAFNHVKGLIDKDVALLEQRLGVNFDWDLTADTWMVKG